MYLLLLKYDLNGNFQWAVTNNSSPWFIWNIGYDVDTEGSYVYVTGEDIRGLFVVKYSNNGNLLWYTNGDIWALAGYSIAVNGDIFVTGYYNEASTDDILYEKFNENGTMVWHKIYNGSANLNDRAFGIALDSQTNSVIVGTIDYNYGSGNSKVFVQKQDKNGTTIWSNIYDYNTSTNDFGYDVAIDSSDNIYIVGYVYYDNVNKFDIFLRKYDSSGNVQWTRTYNMPEPTDDYAVDVASDTSGNIYVIGSVETTNQGRNVYLAKYDTSGNNLWSKTIDGGIGASDEGMGIALDSAGNIYISASVSTNSADPYIDYIMVAKYDTSGNPVWQKFAGTTNGNDAGRIAVDNNGDVYVTGTIRTSPTNADIWIRKYDNNGNEIWTKTYNNTSLPGSDDEGRGIWVDNRGYLYVCGYEEQSGEGVNIWIRKMDITNGNEIWTRTYNNVSANNDDVGFAICVDSSDNVIAGGWIEQTTKGNYDGWLRQYTSNGSTNWTKINSSSQYIEAIIDLTVDDKGNIYATGITNYNLFIGSGPIWVAKYDTAGNVQWTRGYNNPAGLNAGYGITLTADNDIIVVGKDAGNNGDIWIRKYEGAKQHLSVTKLTDIPATNAGGNRLYPVLLFKLNDSDNHTITQLKIKNNGTMTADTDVQYISLFYYPSLQLIGNCFWSNSYSAYIYKGNLLSNTNILASIMTTPQGVSGRTFQAYIPIGGVYCSAGYSNENSIMNNNLITRTQEITAIKLKDMPAVNVSTNTQNVSILAFSISDYYNDAIDTIMITNLGTMVQSDDVSAIKLYYDTDNSTNYSAGDTLIQTAVMANGKYIFTNLKVPAGTNLIATLDTSKTIINGRTFKAAILYGNIYCTNGVNDNNSITNTSSITAVVPHLVNAKVTNITWFPQNSVTTNKINVAVLAFKYFCSDEDPLKILRVTNKGSMQNGTDISSVKVYKDLGLIGKYDAGDIFVATLEWDSTTGKWSNNNLSIGSGTNILVTIDTSSSLRNGYTFKAVISSTNDLQCSNGKSVLSIISNTTVLTADTVPPGPTTIHKIISSVSSITVYCSTATNNPYWYYAVYGTNTNTYFPTPAISTTTQIIITNLDDAVKYYVRVFAKDGAGNTGPVSAETNIETKDGTPPTFAGVQSVSVLDYGSVMIKWDPASDNKTSADNIVYRIYVSQHQGVYNFSAPDYVVTGSTSYTIKGLSSGKYYFVVRAVDEAGNEDSNTKEISINVVSTENSLDNVYIYPNPVYGGNLIRIAKLTKEVKIRIYNIKGELIKEIEKNSNQPEIMINPDELNLSTGVYFIYMEAEGVKSVIRKLIYIK